MTGALSSYWKRPFSTHPIWAILGQYPSAGTAAPPLSPTAARSGPAFGDTPRSPSTIRVSPRRLAPDSRFPVRCSLPLLLARPEVSRAGPFRQGSLAAKTPGNQIARDYFASVSGGSRWSRAHTSVGPGSFAMKTSCRPSRRTCGEIRLPGSRRPSPPVPPRGCGNPPQVGPLPAAVLVSEDHKQHCSGSAGHGNSASRGEVFEFHRSPP